MLVYEHEEAIRSIAPNFAVLGQCKQYIMVTAPACQPNGSSVLNPHGLAIQPEAVDFVSRFFCPNDVVPEDPVTGSAHCTAAPYWSEVLGKPKLLAFQASKRGGLLQLEVIGSEPVEISGPAVVFANGVPQVAQ